MTTLSLKSCARMLLPVFLGSRTARSRCCAVSERTIARPACCSSSMIRVPAYLPDVATAGSEPQNDGVMTT